MRTESVLSEETIGGDPPPDPPVRRRRAPRWRRVTVVLLVLACLGALGAGWFVRNGMQARDHLRRAAALVQQLRQQVEKGDAAAAAGTLAALQRETRQARADTGDPSWRLGHGLPGAGDDLAAVRTLAVALDDLARDGLPPLVATARRIGLRAVAPVNGRIDLAQLQAVAPQLTAADTAVRRARDQVASIPVDALLPAVKEAVVKARADLEKAAAATGTAARAGALLPRMLGADRPRTYLVLFQNLAEVRATGGMPGAYVVVSAAGGAIRIVDQDSAAGLQSLTGSVLPVHPEHRALYSDRMGTFPADINFSPDFPTAAKLAREMYRVRSGRTVDGVLATDPVALSYLLSVLGPVPVSSGPDLTQHNAVRVLLSDTYGRGTSPRQQDRYFAAAAMATFQAVMQRSFDPGRLTTQLARAAGERRILLWSATPAEQEAIAGTVLGGVLPRSDGAEPTVGVFLNDGSGAKLGYYLRASTELAVVGGCRSDGRRKLSLRVTLGSTAPKSGLSKDVLGLGLAGDPYTVRTVVAVYSPTGGALDDVKLDGVKRRFGTGPDGPRSVAVVAVDVKPGASRTLEATLLTGVPATGWGATVTPRLWTTPLVTTWQQSVRTADGCPNRR